LVARYPQLDYLLPESQERNTDNLGESIFGLRPSFDHVYMAIAEIVALRSTCLRGKVGAVIVKDTRIVSIGYNGSPSGMAQCDQCGCIIDSERGGCIRTIHAEQNAIAYASRIGIPIEGATIYVTISPCIDCAKLIIASGICRLVYLEEYRNSYALEYLSSSGIETKLLNQGLSEIYRDFYVKGGK
jgi:dCMP deaminase